MRGNRRSVTLCVTMALAASIVMVSVSSAYAVETNRTVVGQVVDADTDLPVVGAQVRIFPAAKSVFSVLYPMTEVTGADGRFTFTGFAETEVWRLRVDHEDAGYAGGFYDGAGRTVTKFESQANGSSAAAWDAGVMNIVKAPSVQGTIYLNDGLPSDFSDSYTSKYWYVAAYAKNSSTGKWEKVSQGEIQSGGSWRLHLRPPATYRFKQTGPVYRGGSWVAFPAWYAGDFVVSRLALAKSVSVSAPKGGVDFRLRSRFPTPWNTKTSRIVVTPNGDGWGDTAKISYKLDRRATVTIKVKNAKGDTVRYLRKGVKQDSGTRSATFTGKRSSGSRLPNGYYNITVKTVNSRGYGKLGDAEVFLAYGLKAPTTGLATTKPQLIEPLSGIWGSKKKFSFALNQKSYVTIWVYNKSGLVRKVKTNAVYTAGDNDVTWSSDSLAKGTYRYFILASNGGSSPKTSTHTGLFVK